MEPTITVALIMTAGTVGAQVIIAAINKRTMSAVINLRIDILEKKVEKHNQLQDRMRVVEESTKSAHHRINELREDIRNEN